MNAALKKNEKYRVKYMRTHKVLSLVLDNDKDADIIEWLGKQENRSEAVRSAIRSEIAYEDNRPMGEVLHDFLMNG